jgi:hypothetical protein
MKIIHLLLLSALLTLPLPSQTCEWRFKGGAGDGHGSHAIGLCDFGGASMQTRYKGSGSDGHDMLSIALSGLEGVEAYARYRGGSADGYDMLPYALIGLEGSAMYARYRGGYADGYGMLPFTLSDLKGGDMHARYFGGSNDGYDMFAFGLTDFSGASMLVRYAGGSNDGYSHILFDATDLNGAALYARYRGAAGDGYDMIALALSDLDGTSMFARYLGGGGDGHAIVDWSPPSGNAPRFVARAFLQGPFLGSSMSNDLNTNNYLPLTHPYGGAPWLYTGPENVTAIPSTRIVDWVLCEIRTGASASTVVERKAGFVISNGAIVGTDGVSPLRFDYSPSGYYYFVVRHRNHLPVMSAAPVLASALGPGAIDFTASMSNAYGTDPMKEVVTGTFGLWAGDVNANGNVRYNGSANDRPVIFTRTGSLTNVVLGYYPEDVNMNGQVRYNGTLNDRAVIFGVTGSLTGVRVSQVP